MGPSVRLPRRQERNFPFTEDAKLTGWIAAVFAACSALFLGSQPISGIIIRSRHGGTVYAASNGPCAGDGAPCAHGILGTPSVTKKQTRVAVSCPAHCRPVVCDHKLRRHLGRRCVAGCPCIGGRDDANRAESGYGFGREAANCSPATGGKCDLSSRGGLKAPTARRWRQPWQGPAWGPMGMPMGGLPCLRRICAAQSCNNALCNAPQEAPFFTCRLRFHDGFPIIMKRRTKA